MEGLLWYLVMKLCSCYTPKMKPTEPDKWWFPIDISVSGFQSFNYHQCTWFLIMAPALLKKFWTSSTSTSVICEESFPISHSVIQLTMKSKKWCWTKICRSTIFKLNFSHNVDHTCHSSGWETYIFLRNHLLSSSAKISWVAFLEDVWQHVPPISFAQFLILKWVLDLFS